MIMVEGMVINRSKNILREPITFFSLIQRKLFSSWFSNKHKSLTPRFDNLSPISFL